MGPKPIGEDGSIVDRITTHQRSENMRRIKGRNSAPELAVRRVAHNLGYRFRLHQAGLPGRPDIVFSARRKVIFVHGCFWHRHDNCKYAYTPKSRTEFWLSKFKANVARDAKALAELVDSGWGVLVIWECETGDANVLASRLISFLGEVCAAKSCQAGKSTRSKRRSLA